MNPQNEDDKAINRTLDMFIEHGKSIRQKKEEQQDDPEADLLARCYAYILTGKDAGEAKSERQAEVMADAINVILSWEDRPAVPARRRRRTGGTRKKVE